QTVLDFLPRVATGWSEETKLEGARILKGMFGSHLSGDKAKEFDQAMHEYLGLNSVGEGQMLLKTFVTLATKAAREMGAREPGSVILLFQQNYPNMGMDPDAIRGLTNKIRMEVYRKLDHATAMDAWFNR